MPNGFRMDLDSVKVVAAGSDDRTVVRAANHSKQSSHFFEAVEAKVNCEFEVIGVMVLVAKAPVQHEVAEVPHLALDGSAPEGRLLGKAAGRKVEVAGQGKRQVELARRVAHVREVGVVCC
jgi:hypothetical protein